MITLDDCRYKAFISYSHADEKWAAWLHRSLETYRVPKYLRGQETAMGPVPERIAPVFRDREELASSTDLGSDLREALVQSSTQIVICSKASANSHWVNEEILAFKRLGRADRIFCLVVDGEPYASEKPGQEQAECLAPALHFVMDEEGEVTDTSAELIVADARPGKDGNNNAKIKLLAGILGVGFESLKQHELQRRNRRMAAVAALSSVGMVAAIGLATTAVLARQEAEEQKERAESESETARQTSSFLISLFKVSDPGEARGQSITAREILSAGAERIDSELNAQPEVQTRLMNTIGRVYTSLGLYEDARDLLVTALSRRRAIEGIGTLEMSQSLVSLANVKTRTAEFEDAEALYLESIDTLRDNDEQDSDEMANALAGLAEIYYQLGRYKEAEPVLKEVLAHRRRNSGALDPSVADAIEEIGLNQYDLGDLASAELRLREALELRRRLLGSEPHPDVSENLNNLALVLLDIGKFDESEQLYGEALVMNRQLLGDKHPDVAMLLNNLGQLHRARGNLEQAAAYYLDSLSMKRELLGPTHPEVALVLHELAFLDYDQGFLEPAIAYTRQALSIQEESLGINHPEVAASISRLGRWLSEAGEHDEAETLLRQAVILSSDLLDADHPDVAIAEIGLADALARTDHLDEALELAERAVPKLMAAFGEDHWITAVGNSIRGGVLLQQGEFQQAEAWLTDSYSQLSATAGARPVYVRAALVRVIDLYESWGNADLASKYRESLSEIELEQIVP